METWQGATGSDHRLYSVIRLVFLNHLNLLEFFFENKRARIRLEPLDLLKSSEGFSDGERVLIRVALDIWSGSGNAKVWQLVEVLDADNFSNVLKALGNLRCLERDN